MQWVVLPMMTAALAFAHYRYVEKYFLSSENAGCANRRRSAQGKSAQKKALPVSNLCKLSPGLGTICQQDAIGGSSPLSGVCHD